VKKQFKRASRYIFFSGWLISIFLLGLFADSAAGQSAAEQPYRLNIDVYSGTVPSGESNSEALLIQLAALEKGVGSAPQQLPNIVHIDHAADNAFDVSAEAKTNGYMLTVRGHVVKQPDGLKINFSELGAPGYAGATELLIPAGERRLWRLPDIVAATGATLETVVLVSTPRK
jgi:hypothetical protein